MAKRITFRTSDFPAADADGQMHAMLFDLCDGGELVLEFGDKTFQKFLAILSLAPAGGRRGSSKRRKKRAADQR